MADSVWRYAVYVVTNNISGRHYVGMTSRSVELRWVEHVKAAATGVEQGLHRGIRKHGVAAFSVREVSRSRTKEDAFHVEQALIAEYRSIGWPLYNMTAGGEGVVDLNEAGQLKKKEALRRAWQDPETREKMEQAIRDNMTPEVKAKMSAAALKSWADPEKKLTRREKLKGRRISEETKEKIGAAQRGRKLTDEQKNKISVRLKGKRLGVKFSVEHRQAISRARQGLKLSPEHKESISRANKGKCGIFERTPEMKAHMSSVFKGRKLSPEQLQRRREKMEEKRTNKGEV